jgi:breast cancer 2 susceptibility protein
MKNVTERELTIPSATAELKQITPALALYYSFHTPSSTLPSEASPSPPKLLGPTAALEELIMRGCSLATKLWVDNHWCLILWKLAGMVCLEPERERDPQTKRWCWAEVIRQLLYRCRVLLHSRNDTDCFPVMNEN